MSGGNQQSAIGNRQSDPTGPEVAERLRIAGYVIEKLRAAVPAERRHVEQVIGPFAAAHEDMVKDLCRALQPHLGALTWKITDHYSAPHSSRVIVAAWKGETSKSPNVETSKRSGG